MEKKYVTNCNYKKYKLPKNGINGLIIEPRMMEWLHNVNVVMCSVPKPCLLVHLFDVFGDCLVNLNKNLSEKKFDF